MIEFSCGDVLLNGRKVARIQWEDEGEGSIRLDGKVPWLDGEPVWANRWDAQEEIHDAIEAAQERAVPTIV